MKKTTLIKTTHLQKQSLFVAVLITATDNVTRARFSSVIIPREEARKPPGSSARSAELSVAGRQTERQYHTAGDCGSQL